MGELTRVLIQMLTQPLTVLSLIYLWLTLLIDKGLDVLRYSASDEQRNCISEKLRRVPDII